MVKTNKELREWVELHCASDDECERAFDDTDDYPELQAEIDECEPMGTPVSEFKTPMELVIV